MESSKVGIARFGALGFLVLGLGCAAFAAYLIGDMMRGKYTGVRVAPVVVAKEQLRAGVPVVAGSLEVREWPETSRPEGAFASIEALLAAHDGTVVTVGILPGEPVVSTRLGTSQNGTGIAPLVTHNMRAIAFRVDDALGFTGLVYPGAYVDLIATVRDPSGAGATARIAVQRARVLSVGMDADVATRRRKDRKVDSLSATAESSSTFVSLEVTPEDAEIISVARNGGVIDLVLRNATDDKMMETPGAGPAQFAPRLPVALGEVPGAGEDPSKARAPGAVRPIHLVANEGPDVPPKPAKKPAARRATSPDAAPPTTIETYRAQ